MTDLCSINSRTYWHSVNTIHLLTHAGVLSCSPHIAPCHCWVSAGEAPPSPSCWGFPNTGDSPKTLQNESWTRVPMNSFCVCVCVMCLLRPDKTGLLFVYVPRLFLVPVRISLTFVWLRQLFPLIQAAASEKHSKLGCEHDESVCDRNVHNVHSHVQLWGFSMKTLETYTGGVAADVAAQLDGGISLETRDSAAPWWLKEELQLRAHWIHPLSSLPAIIIGWIGRCRLMVSWPISSEHYHIEDENKFSSGAINLLSIKCDLVFSTTYLSLIIILTPLSYIK